MQTTKVQPRFYAACLASYSEGILHGKWIDATDDAEGMYLEVEQMLEASPSEYAEEWEIHDHEYLDIDGGGGFDCTGVLHDIAERVRMYEKYSREAVEAYVSNFGRWDESHFENSYMGYTTDRKDWSVDHWVECSGQTREVLDFFIPYLNEDLILREYENNYSFVEYEGEDYIFAPA